MWTRSAMNRTTGLMTVECTDWSGKQFFKGEFATLAEAETAGQDAERRMTNAMSMPTVEAFGDIEMTDEELLAELMDMGFAA
jgi:hypothetical protein